MPARRIGTSVRQKQERPAAQSRRAPSSKHSLSTRRPLPGLRAAHRSAHGKSSSSESEREQKEATSAEVEADQQRAILAAIDRYAALPSASAFARHRLRVLRRALELLRTEEGERSAEAQAELGELLAKLEL
ncbi:hypothetical protein H632_c1987p1 [Helicosporidium sp. ATCC 50920]|nr:hypothetical protein H632_c1987p1 [Helicosporidium sp. ATCC 50920]|eukprot:KDD73626.1 hypothetical protein H632_c1987p1 [Helicosporidium sp. ATCC 50920]